MDQEIFAGVAWVLYFRSKMELARPAPAQSPQCCRDEAAGQGGDKLPCCSSYCCRKQC